MAAQGFLLIASFLLILLVLAKPLGSGLARLIAAVPLPGVAGVERILWRTLGITDHEMNWRQYLLALLTLNLLGLGILFCLLFWQEWLPLNPQRLPGLSWDLALNTAVSFVTNTNWQAYSGESTLSYFSQMAGLTVQNFLSAATGIAVVFALIRAFTRQNVHTLGNAWQDLVRITLWILFPVALIIALFLSNKAYRKICRLISPSPPLKALNNFCRWVRLLRRKRSKCLAPTAAVSLTPTLRIRSKTLPRSLIWRRCWRYF
ncbi:potassium-transporting ATPase subunit A [Salmonella enterica subsp. enterica serovar Berta str. ATCC 8392]|nr:potassium-transporting ATPase subunit A [Salmonella enterica subsp. enterica serovar Berta str. ATCC 8392]